MLEPPLSSYFNQKESELKPLISRIGTMFETMDKDPHLVLSNAIGDDGSKIVEILIEEVNQTRAVKSIHYDFKGYHKKEYELEYRPLTSNKLNFNIETENFTSHIEMTRNVIWEMGNVSDNELIVLENLDLLIKNNPQLGNDIMRAHSQSNGFHGLIVLLIVVKSALIINKLNQKYTSTLRNSKYHITKWEQNQIRTLLSDGIVNSMYGNLVEEHEIEFISEVTSRYGILDYAIIVAEHLIISKKAKGNINRTSTNTLEIIREALVTENINQRISIEKTEIENLGIRHFVTLNALSKAVYFSKSDPHISVKELMTWYNETIENNDLIHYKLFKEMNQQRIIHDLKYFNNEGYIELHNEEPNLQVCIISCTAKQLLDYTDIAIQKWKSSN